MNFFHNVFGRNSENSNNNVNRNNSSRNNSNNRNNSNRNNNNRNSNNNRTTNPSNTNRGNSNSNNSNNSNTNSNNSNSNNNSNRRTRTNRSTPREHIPTSPASQQRQMEQYLAALFAQATAAGTTHAHAHAHPQGPTGPPPASRKAIRQLPTIMVTSEDLVDESNRECCICFDEHNLGDKVIRLPCAHIYHPHCITEWLTKHCTCPVCRYELQTDDYTYEQDRTTRMSNRKPRYAKYELQRMKISDLKALCQRLNLNNNIHDIFNGCGGYTKNEIIELILNSNKIDVIASPDPIEYENIEVLRKMGVGKLKKAMMEAGVFFDSKDVVEKEDMVQIFVNSGRIVFTDVLYPLEEVEEEQKQRQYEEERNVKVGTQNQNLDVANNDQKQNNSDSNIQNEAADYDHDDYDGKEEVKRPRIDGQPTSRSFNEDEHDYGIETTPLSTTTVTVTANMSNDNTPNTSGTASSSTAAAAAASRTTSVSPPSPSPYQESQQSDRNSININTTTTTNGRSTTYSTYESADISGRSVGELKQLGRSLNIDLSHCLEKREMVQAIVMEMTRRGVGFRYGGGVIS